MRLRFLGAAQTVTGSCHLLEVGATRVMVDCGMFQGPRTIRERNYQDFSVPPESIDYVLLTHAHIDHSGLIPKLVKKGFRGKVLATGATVDLCEVMLPDSGHIQEMEVERLNRKNRRAGRPLVEPIYSADEARESMRLFKRVQYEEVVHLTNEITVRFQDAGHILGSSILEMWVKEGGEQTKLVFTGDLGMVDKPFVRDPAVVEEADYVIMESTYGARRHRDTGNKLELLHEIVWETYRKGGNLVIPAFAVERTQELLYSLNQLILQKRFPPMKIYIDSPMAVAATEVFRKHRQIFDTETNELINQGNNPLEMSNLFFSRTTEDSIALNQVQSGAVILAASGMCDAGRIKHHLKHNLWRPECTVLFVGYQAPGTKGQRLRDGAGMIRIHGEDVAVRADIRTIDGFSAHADQRALLDWLGRFKTKPEKVFLVHGEPQAAAVLGELITSEYNIPVSIPAWHENVQLTPGITITSDELRQVYDAVSAKLADLLNDGQGSGKYASIVSQLKELNGMLEGLKKEVD